MIDIYIYKYILFLNSLISLSKSWCLVIAVNRNGKTNKTCSRAYTAEPKKWEKDIGVASWPKKHKITKRVQTDG